MIESHVELTVPRVSQVATMCFIFDSSHCGAERSFGPVCTFVIRSIPSFKPSIYPTFSVPLSLHLVIDALHSFFLLAACSLWPTVANRPQLRTAVASCTISLPARGAGKCTSRSDWYNFMHTTSYKTPNITII